MFGPLGVPEIIFLLVLALLIFGPRKLPEIGRTLGKGLAEFRKASNELRRTLNAEALEQELRESDPRRLLDEKYPAKPQVKHEVETPAEEAAPDEPRATIERPADTVARGGSEDGGSEDGGSEDGGSEDGGSEDRPRDDA